MSPSVCPDSEEDDEDELLQGDEDTSQQSLQSWVAGHAEKYDELSVPLNGQRSPGGTNSSELRRQIGAAGRALFDPASQQAFRSAPAMPSSTSPVLRRDKRRRATEVASEPVASPSRSVKRTKTMNQKTYGSTSSRTPRPADDENWKAFRNGDEPVAKTSQSAGFSDHSSGPNPSGGLPAGTIRQDFMDHEPNLMFRDTGSTNAFNESSEQRIMETVLTTGDARPTNDEPSANVTASDKQQDSSFPWSESAGATQSQSANNTNPPPGEPDICNAGEAKRDAEREMSATKPTVENEMVAALEEDSHRAEEPEVEARDDEIHVSLSERNEQQHKVPPKSSPIVEIPRHRAASATSSKDTPVSSRKESTPKKTRGRRRKTVGGDDQERKPELDPLNSDDKLIGLPKERYMPRPSRRRATDIVEPVDFSAVPERAAKKRRKTATTNVNDNKADAVSATTKQAESQTITPSIEEDDSRTEVPQGQSANPTFAADDKQAPPLHRRHTPIQPSVEPLSPPPPAEFEMPSPKKRDQSGRSNPSSTSRVVMGPPPLPPSSKKKLSRSKTTIFEDHVAFGGFRKSPTLSQQQAERAQSVLSETPNSASRARRYRTRPVVEDDDDEEDELAQDHTVDEEDPPPKERGRSTKAAAANKAAKSRVLADSEDEVDDLNAEQDGSVDGDDSPPRKRGRRAKAAVTKKGKQIGNILPDSEDQEEEEEGDFNDNKVEAEEIKGPPKKKRPGRPPEAKPQEEPKGNSADGGEDTTAPGPDPDKVNVPSSDTAAVSQGESSSSPSRAALERKDPNRQIENAAAKSDEAPTAKPSSTPTKPADAKTVHSPIKSSSGSGTQYRVGLSRKRKIPSLLKSIRPPKPSTTR
ncbi:Hypothetical predicted protein [Lecanosticta acicola]|uniref:Uncharacterized protein n=1 Tax=Lecanosticta acicola TaxID=111012 RepID=A0AAI9E5T4_9PEZI|nr:Hypothetical predicted protein [Lecanosticta acicola]